MQRRVSHMPFLPTVLNYLCLAAITSCIHIFYLLKWPLSNVTHLLYHTCIHSTSYIHGLASSLIVSCCSYDVSQFQRNVLCVCPCGDLKNKGSEDPAHCCYIAVQMWTRERLRNAACAAWVVRILVVLWLLFWLCHYCSLVWFAWCCIHPFISAWHSVGSHGLVFITLYVVRLVVVPVVHRDRLRNWSLTLTWLQGRSYCPLIGHNPGLLLASLLDITAWEDICI